jgi:hypothetical protein
MTNEHENSSSGEDFWKEIVKLGAKIGGGLYVGKKICDKIINYQRKDTALEEFDNQDLSWWEREKLKNAFKQHNFYVTKFPDTPRDIFPLAAKILYKLIKFHNNSRIDTRLGAKILKDCETLHKIAERKQISPINQDWQYWKLLQHEIVEHNIFGNPKKDFWGKIKYKREYYLNPSWNLEDFLNDFEGGIIRFGLFGVDNKRVDFCYFRKKWDGKLYDRTEVDETEKTLDLVWRMVKHPKYVAEIYDKYKDVVEEAERIMRDNDIYLDKIVEPILTMNEIIIRTHKTSKNYSYADSPNEPRKIKIAIRDSGWVFDPNTYYPLVSCRYCERRSYNKLKYDPDDPLQFHHIYPKKGLKFTNRIKDYMKKEYNLSPKLIGHISNFSSTIKGPTEPWNLVIVCKNDHPPKNYPTYEESRRKMSNDEDEQKTLLLLPAYLKFVGVIK